MPPEKTNLLTNMVSAKPIKKFVNTDLFTLENCAKANTIPHRVSKIEAMNKVLKNIPFSNTSCKA